MLTTRISQVVREKIKADIEIFQGELLSALVERVFDGTSINKFLDLTLFGIQNDESSLKFTKVKNFIDRSLKELEMLPIPVIQKENPYKVTEFGKFCHIIGLSPKTMNLLHENLDTALNNNEISLDELNKIPEDLTRSLRNWFNLFLHSVEINKANISERVKDSSTIPDILYDWINGKKYFEIAENYFGTDAKSYQNTVVFIQQFAVYYGSWIAYSLNELLKYLHYEIPESLKFLPMFLQTGTSNWVEMIIQILEICDRGEPVNYLASYFKDLNKIGVPKSEDIIQFFATLLKITKIDVSHLYEETYPELIPNVWNKIEYWQNAWQESNYGKST